jgi:hypothetical protein
MREKTYNNAETKNAERIVETRAKDGEHQLHI